MARVLRHASPARSSPPSPRTSARIAFGVIIVLVLGQAVWWAVFQRGYIVEVGEERVAAWRADAAVANAAFRAAGEDAALRDELLRTKPHLAFRDGTFVVDAEVLGAFRDEQGGHLRMIAWEAPSFVLAILWMLALLARALRQERELKRSQQNFLSAVTHEFKTPVATLRLLIETAQLRDMPEGRRRDYLERMTAEVDRLERTADQVLAAARLEASPEAPPLEARDLREVVVRRIDEMRPGLEARGARLHLESGSRPLPVSLDEDGFALVLGNLLDNAVKYTPAHEKPVTVRLEEQRELVELHVDDEGIGVGEAERERIFARFHRSGDESTRRTIGVGLGLHLVKSTVEAMNGWVRVGDNPAGRGSRFTVVLPRRVGAERANPSEAALPDPATPPGASAPLAAPAGGAAEPGARRPATTASAAEARGEEAP